LTIFDSIEAYNSSKNEGLVVDDKCLLYRIKSNEIKEEIKNMEEYYEL